jgi:hypothetical protein
MKGRPPIITRDALALLWATDLRQVDIARAFGVRQQSVSFAAKVFGLPPRKRAPNKGSAPTSERRGLATPKGSGRMQAPHC